MKMLVKLFHYARSAARSAPMMFDWLAGFICLWSFGLSAIESMVNQDFHHWGLMYVPAIELKQGLIPCKDVLIYYGIFTSVIQSMGLSVFGENFRALGLTTGLFFSLSLLLQYHIFKAFLSRHAAFFALVIVFLLHGYMIYPWSNYFAYPFELLAVVALIKSDRLRQYVLAGFWVGLALLARYSALQAVLPPFILFFGYQYVSQHRSPKSLLRRLMGFVMGLLIPLVTFLAYLIVNHGWDNFILHNALTLQTMVAKDVASLNSGAGQFVPNLLSGRVFTVDRDSRSIGLSWLLGLDILVFLVIMGRSIQRRIRSRAIKPLTDRREAIVMLVSLVAIFGYLNGLNLYQVFRVVNGASIGVGLVFYGLEWGMAHKSVPKFLPWLGITGLSLLALNWSNSLIFVPTTSVLAPWQWRTPPVELVAQTNVKILAGKVVPRPFNDHYSQLQQVISGFDPTWPIVNYTEDTISVLVDPNRPRLQKSPAYFPLIQAGLPDEVARIDQAIAARKAIVLAPLDVIVPPGQRLYQSIGVVAAPEVIMPPGYCRVATIGNTLVLAPE
jgi:Dolichyl-phosphate-mannose-protein mannosyltransferase